MSAMITAAVVGVGGTLYAQNEAENAATEAARRTEATYSPYRKAGEQALGRISDIMAGTTKVDLASIPGYTAGLEAGTSAISREAAAQGTRGGGTLASLFGFGQQYAGKAFDSYMNQLAGIANLGVGGAAGTAQAQMAQGDVAAAGALGQGQTLSGLVTAGAGLYGQRQGAGLTAEQYGQQQADLARQAYPVSVG